MIRAIRLLFFVLLLPGCSTAAGSGPVSSKLAVQVYRGTLSLTLADGVEAGRLKLSDGECLGVSLPKQAADKLRVSGPQIVSIKGSLFQVPDDIEVATIHVNGRLVGFRQCKNKYVFIRRSDDISWGAK
jgi:hypothetical protein